VFRITTLPPLGRGAVKRASAWDRRRDSTLKNHFELHLNSVRWMVWIH